MLHGITSEQEYCLYISDSVSATMEKLYIFSYKSMVIGA